MAIKISATLELGKTFEAQFQDGAMKEIRKVLKRSFPRIQKGISKALRSVIRNRIMDSPEYGSIIGGTLRGELGLPDGMNRITGIIDQWVESVAVKVGLGSGKKLGIVSVHMIKSDWGDVLSLSESVLTYTNRKGKSISLEWLRWLLLEGDRSIIAEYDFSPSNQGRTGLGIMIKRRGGWKVPSEFSGTSNDNFATRSFEGIEKDIEIIIRQEITKGIK